MRRLLGDLGFISVAVIAAFLIVAFVLAFTAYLRPF
jgi:hypothetical protein